MPTIDKTKSQTYNFLIENISIEDIKKQENIEFKEIKNKRHSGKTYRIDNINNQLINDDLSENNTENSKTVASNLTDNEKDQKTNNDIWTKFKNYLNWPSSNAEELIQAQRTIQEKDKEIEQLKKQNEELKQSKQSNVNLKKYSYNSITIYDEKQRKKTETKKIHEEILPINNKIYFITTIQHIDNSINEKVIYFQQLTNGSIKIFKQNKQYDNIDDYKKDITLINDISINNNSQFVPIKDFLKKHNNFKLKPTKKEWKTWGFIIAITLLLVVVAPICTFVIPTLIPATATALLLETKVIIAVSFAVAGIVFKEISSLYENATQKVKSWFRNKYFKSKDQKEKENKERQSIIKNLTSDKLETKLDTQYDILKQELDNRKNINPKELINNNKINHNSNSILENSIVEPLKPDTFDSSIRNTVNNQELQPSTISRNNWNKVKRLLTT